MKLIFCPNCHDIVKLDLYERFCQCGHIKGKYKEDGLHAIISKEAIPIGFSDNTFVVAIKNRDENLSYYFESFVIAKKCETIKYE